MDSYLQFIARPPLFQFAYPYLQGSVGIMVKAELESPSGWSFVRPFSASLWIAIGATLIVWPVLIFLVEGYSKRSRIPGRDCYLGIQEATASCYYMK